jgi:hypothetical protein
MGGSPSPKATVIGPFGHNRCTRASGPGFVGGRARSGARSTASVSCAGVLCGSCVAPLSPGGPAFRRRELDPRGAQRLATDAGPMAGLIECAFNPLCVCGCGSSAPTRVCLDAQVCPPSWVSFGLEPASDGSRRSHLSSAATLSRLGSGSTTTPSTSTVTSGTVGRPHQRPARCHLPRAGPEGACVPARAGGYSPAWGARSPASGGSRLFTGTWPGGSAEASLGGRAAWAAASAVRAGARCALLAGGVFCA